jgi:hypothetical protein
LLFICASSSSLSFKIFLVLRAFKVTSCSLLRSYMRPHVTRNRMSKRGDKVFGVFVRPRLLLQLGGESERDAASGHLFRVLPQLMPCFSACLIWLHVFASSAHSGRSCWFAAFSRCLDDFKHEPLSIALLTLICSSLYLNWQLHASHDLIFNIFCCKLVFGPLPRPQSSVLSPSPFHLTPPTKSI